MHKRNIFQRIFGIPATKQPADAGCWSFSDGTVEVQLEKAIELTGKGNGVSLEGKGLPDRILLFQGVDENFYAFVNKCKHAGRKLDPLPDSEHIQCCSVGKATYDYSGKVSAGNVEGELQTYPVEKNESRLIIKIT